MSCFRASIFDTTVTVASFSFYFTQSGRQENVEVKQPQPVTEEGRGDKMRLIPDGMSQVDCVVWEENNRYHIFHTVPYECWTTIPLTVWDKIMQNQDSTTFRLDITKLEYSRLIKMFPPKHKRLQVSRITDHRFSYHGTIPRDWACYGRWQLLLEKNSNITHGKMLVMSINEKKEIYITPWLIYANQAPTEYLVRSINPASKKETHYWQHLFFGCPIRLHANVSYQVGDIETLKNDSEKDTTYGTVCTGTNADGTTTTWNYTWSIYVN